MGNRRPMPFYAGDWLADEWVDLRRNDCGGYERLGLYTDLLAWASNEGSIPGEPHELARRCGHMDPRRFARLWDDGHATGLRWKFVGVTSGVVGGEPGERLMNLKLQRAEQAQNRFLEGRHKPQKKANGRRTSGASSGEGSNVGCPNLPPKCLPISAYRQEVHASPPSNRTSSNRNKEEGGEGEGNDPMKNDDRPILAQAAALAITHKDWKACQELQAARDQKDSQKAMDVALHILQKFAPKDSDSQEHAA